jgi:hypothetical protein
VRDNKPYCEEHYHYPRQQQPSTSSRLAAPTATQPQQKPTLKPKPPIIAKKPDFSSSSPKPIIEPELKIPEINTYSSSNSSIRTADSHKKTANPGGSTKKVCHSCNSVIDGSAASALGYNYHIHHFQCSQCDRALSSRVPGNEI